MVLARSALAVTLLSGSLAHAAAPAAKRPAPTAPDARADAVVAARIVVEYHDVRALARVLKDIFAVQPDRGAVRAILDDSRDATLVVFATPAGHADVRRVLADLVAGTP
ncbi:hypothetical protein OV203_09560 [Nannocystis sp. ILAH1]|uniref:hypothetical protein n=1 Tax=unclassified Nannocystis TaxID=2627009 RepID=UPI00226DBF2E|nr:MULTISPECIES: hypothetical protein [unclassified Nannocystis]MCY0987368.1 hypothetical protein [Nannocystis sp. ILAH1]MCY1070837.1 hypothetical protein [Nannocystis sp. RBIL2]